MPYDTSRYNNSKCQLETIVFSMWRDSALKSETCRMKRTHLLAGRLTPAANVLVQQSKLSTPVENASSTSFLSSLVSPLWWYATPIGSVRCKTGHNRPSVLWVSLCNMAVRSLWRISPSDLKGGGILERFFCGSSEFTSQNWLRHHADNQIRQILALPLGWTEHQARVLRDDFGHQASDSIRIDSAHVPRVLQREEAFAKEHWNRWQRDTFKKRASDPILMR